MNNYTELHLHDYYSSLDGLNSPAEYFVRAKELGMTHLSQTNHGTLIGHREFQREAQKAGVIPILGNEAYISATDRFDRRSKAKRSDGTNTYNHIILLAQNETGLQTLYKLNEIAWSEGFYSKPRIDMDALEEHNEGLIVLSGCLNGLLCKALEAGNLDLAMNTAHRLKSILKDRFFIEVQSHNPVEINKGLFTIADAMGIRPVITSDCHYARKEDLWIEEAMLILSTNPKANYAADMSKAQRMGMLERFNYLYPERKMTFEEIEIYLRSADEHLTAMAVNGFTRTDIISNTQVVAEMIGDYPYHQGLDLLPTPKSESPHTVLVRKARAGLKELGLAGKPEYEARLKEELDILEAKNFSTYFLIVANTIAWARKQGILVGPGRGSAAGSLVCYALGITQVDPIEYGLLFFRFINPERNDFPDIDTDFEDRRRGEVKDYLRRQFKNVASIATVNKFQGKSSVRDAARVFRIPLAEVNKALKGVDAPSDKPELFFELFRNSPNGKEFIKKYPEVIKLTDAIQGRIRGTGMHAAGVVISKEPLANIVPIETAKDPNDKSGNRIPLAAVDMNEAADIGLIKLDILGLKALSVIDDTLEMVAARKGVKVDLLSLDLSDRNVYKMISEGFTRGIFQAEGGTFTKWILEVGATEFNDLVIGTSIARPGPLTTVGEQFKRRKFGREEIRYDHEVMRKHLEETLGCIVYQEQVMLAMTDLGGMTMSEADKVRKIIGKKRDVSEFDAFKEKFVEGASQKIPKKLAQKLWKDFEAHAGYSFNKSHAVVYSLITYWTAWLKFYYPLEFMYAILKNEADNDVRTEYLIEAKRLGLRVILPNVNSSDIDFSISDDGIRFGLANIKFISDTTGNRIIEYRPFTTYGQLVEKVMEKGSGLNTRILSALNAVGAATFIDNPKRGDERDNFYEYLGIPAFQKIDLPPRVKAQIVPLDEYEEKGCFAVIGMVKKIKHGNGWSRVEIVDETGTAGIFHSENTPIEKGQMYAMLVADNRIARYIPIDELNDKSRNTFAQFLMSKGNESLTDNFYDVVAFQSRTTKAGKKMADVVLADSDKNMVRALVFPKAFFKAYSKCQEGATVGVTFGETDDGTVFIEDVW